MRTAWLWLHFLNWTSHNTKPVEKEIFSHRNCLWWLSFRSYNRWSNGVAIAFVLQLLMLVLSVLSPHNVTFRPFPNRLRLCRIFGCGDRVDSICSWRSSVIRGLCCVDNNWRCNCAGSHRRTSHDCCWLNGADSCNSAVLHCIECQVATITILVHSMVGLKRSLLLHYNQPWCWRFQCSTNKHWQNATLSIGKSSFNLFTGDLLKSLQQSLYICRSIIAMLTMLPHITYGYSWCRRCGSFDLIRRWRPVDIVSYSRYLLVSWPSTGRFAWRIRCCPVINDQDVKAGEYLIVETTVDPSGISYLSAASTFWRAFQISGSSIKSNPPFASTAVPFSLAISVPFTVGTAPYLSINWRF